MEKGTTLQNPRITFQEKPLRRRVKRNWQMQEEEVL